MPGTAFRKGLLFITFAFMGVLVSQCTSSSASNARRATAHIAAGKF